MQKNRRVNTSAIRSRIQILLFFVTTLTQAQPISGKFAVGPDQNLKLLLSAIQSAKQSLLINIYQVDSPVIVDAIVKKIEQGVMVNLLVEGSPVGNISRAGKSALDTLSEAIQRKSSNKNHLWIMNSRGMSTPKRYRFNHAKYLIIDSNQVYVSSENFTQSGHPESGMIGNRGWDTFFTDSQTAEQLRRIYAEDTDLSYGDVQEYSPEDAEASAPPADSTHQILRESPSKPRSIPAVASGRGQIHGIELITSPQSLDPLLKLIRSAKKEIRLEDMSLPPAWKDTESEQNPIVNELIEAAQRGVKVQVLLNDERVFGSSHDRSKLPGNVRTAQAIQSAALRWNLPIQAKIVDIHAVGITYIHNKGMIIDQDHVLVSSINHTQNSVMNNREVAVDLSSSDAAQYFTPVFDFDWENSSDQLDLLNQNPPRFLPWDASSSIHRSLWESFEDFSF